MPPKKTSAKQPAAAPAEAPPAEAPPAEAAAAPAAPPAAPASVGKAELVDALAKATGGTKAASARFLDALVDAVQGAVARGQRVLLTGFGAFERRERAARTGRNPKSGAAISIPARRTPVFRAGAVFKRTVQAGGAAAQQEAAAA